MLGSAWSRSQPGVSITCASASWTTRPVELYVMPSVCHDADRATASWHCGRSVAQLELRTPRATPLELEEPGDLGGGEHDVEQTGGVLALWRRRHDGPE